MSATFIPFLVPLGLLLFLLEVYFLRKNQIKITLEQTALNISGRSVPNTDGRLAHRTHLLMRI